MTTSPAKARPIIARARELNANDAPTETDNGPSRGEDASVAALKGSTDDPAGNEIAGSIDVLSQDERPPLAACRRPGRDGGGSDRRLGTRRGVARALNDRMAPYLTGTPLVVNFVE